MAQKLLRKVGEKRKVAPKKAAVDAPKRIVKDKIDVETVKGVNELWLFSGAKLPRYFAVECLGVKTCEELKEFGYKATGKGHGSGKYLLFKVKKLYAPSRDFAESVTIRTKMLPKIVTELPSERLRVCEAAVQLDFFCSMFAPARMMLPKNEEAFISMFSGAMGLDNVIGHGLEAA